MSKPKSTSGALLDLWRPPTEAGDPVGCLASTFTFAPMLFEEQCLARFLALDCDPAREDLAYLLERESRLGGVYAGVLVDYTQAGVEHSLRWDVLPVRIPRGKQHAKVSLLAWGRHVRLIVASANLTEPGYRSNFEVAAVVDCTPEGTNTAVLTDAVAFLRSLLGFVPGASTSAPDQALPTIDRAKSFLNEVEQLTKDWVGVRRGGTMRQQLACTLPATGDQAARSSLAEAIAACRSRGGKPSLVTVASPFYDPDPHEYRVTAELYRSMAKEQTRRVVYCVPGVRPSADTPGGERLDAPKSLLTTKKTAPTTIVVGLLPSIEGQDARYWHAKIVGLKADEYYALMIGSSNFTCAGMGVDRVANAEANLVTIADYQAYGREISQLQGVWPTFEEVPNPDDASWIGPVQHEDGEAVQTPLPAGFISATYRAGEPRQIVLQVVPTELPQDWQILACGAGSGEVLSATTWRERGSPVAVVLDWQPVQPPDKLMVQWPAGTAILPLNVEDAKDLPPPPALTDMSADDLLAIWAAEDPGAAFRAWARQRQSSDAFDEDLDAAPASDLDPLGRHDLQATFLHRVRRRARLLARLRASLERPVASLPALQWRLTGLVGVASIGQRLQQEFASANGNANEALLTLADFLLVLTEVKYQADDKGITEVTFGQVYRPFLRDLAEGLNREVAAKGGSLPTKVMDFWEQVVSACQK